MNDHLAVAMIALGVLIGTALALTLTHFFFKTVFAQMAKDYCDRDSSYTRPAHPVPSPHHRAPRA